MFLGHTDKQLAGREWLVDRRSVADPYLFVMLRWAVRLEMGVSEFANLSCFLDRMYADAGVRVAIAAEENAIELAA
jgi:glutathione S-transferase